MALYYGIPYVVPNVVVYEWYSDLRRRFGLFCRHFVPRILTLSTEKRSKRLVYYTSATL